MTKKLSKKKLRGIAEELDRYLICDSLNTEDVIVILQVAFCEDPDQMLDFVHDDISVWEKVEMEFTVAEFCELAGIPTDGLKGLKVILEFYMEIWYCYEDGKGMNDSLFTKTSYEECVNTATKCGMEIVQEIDMSYLDADGNEK
jgi:hypothetical protein